MAEREANDDEVLREFARLHGRAVVQVIRVRERDPGEVEELLSDVLFVASKNLDGLREASEAQVRVWMLRTARFVSANHVRRAVTRRRFVERLAREPIPVAPTPDEVFDQAQEAEAAQVRARLVRRTLDVMAPEYRQVLVLDALGESGSAIGETMGISPGAARKRLARARGRFRELFESINDDEDVCHG